MTLSTLSTDEELVAATRCGDDRAFEELYARYSQRIRGFAGRYTHDHDRAEDITQEAFISALRRLRESDRPIAFRPWIYEIARNACIDEHRRVSRNREVPIERDGELGSLPSFATVPPPEVAVESKQRLDDLRGAFRGLSERHHRVIVLRELEGLSYTQIGDELGMSKMVVESTLFRARRRLTEEFDDLSSGRRCEYVMGLMETQRNRRWRSLGLRDRRALSSHLAHCGSCRREARASGWENRRTPRLAKAAAILPFPFLRLPSALSRNVHHAALPQASAAAQLAESGSLAAAGRAAATAATMIVAAVGGGLASNAVEHGLRTWETNPPAHVARAADGGHRAVAPGALTGSDQSGSFSRAIVGLSWSAGVATGGIVSPSSGTVSGASSSSRGTTLSVLHATDAAGVVSPQDSVLVNGREPARAPAGAGFSGRGGAAADSDGSAASSTGSSSSSDGSLGSTSVSPATGTVTPDDHPVRTTIHGVVGVVKTAVGGDGTDGTTAPVARGGNEPTSAVGDPSTGTPATGATTTDPSVDGTGSTGSVPGDSAATGDAGAAGGTAGQQPVSSVVGMTADAVEAAASPSSAPSGSAPVQPPAS
jgi:RNA polymerase sigma factor (sigma-70 family)